MGEAVLQPALPMAPWIGMAEGRPDPNLAGVPYLHRAGRHVVGPQVEGAPTGQLEPGCRPDPSHLELLLGHAHFVEWLDAPGLVEHSIFHFGTGGHHTVGIEGARPERRHAILGITASPKEYEAFVQLAVARPDVLRHYNAMFGDIYLLNGRFLPAFDVVTLFNLCEFRGPENDAYGAMTDLELTTLLIDKTRPGGFILFYSGSFAFDSAETVLAEWERQREVARVGDFKSLVVYRKRS